MNYLVSCFSYNFKKATTKEEDKKAIIGTIMLIPFSLLSYYSLWLLFNNIMNISPF